MSSIARRHGTTVAALARLNSLSVRAMIYPGQTLALSKQNASVKNVVFTKRAAPNPVKPDIEPAVITEPVEKTEILKPETQMDDESITVNGRTLVVRADDFSIRTISRNLGSLIVKPEETLGHYAEWSKASTSKMRRLNRLPGSGTIRIGDSVKIPLSRVDRDEFERKRLEHHLQLFEDFFEAYSVEEENEIMVKRGQSLWELCVKEHDAPIWLVSLYNPGIKLGYLKPGEKITIPTVIKK